MIPLDTWLLFCARRACALVLTPGPNMLLSRVAHAGQGAARGLRVARRHVDAASRSTRSPRRSACRRCSPPCRSPTTSCAGPARSTSRGSRGDVACARRAATPAVAARAMPRRRASCIRDGLLTRILNPKVALFQLALFPQFVDPARGSVLRRALVLGAHAARHRRRRRFAVRLRRRARAPRWFGAAPGAGRAGRSAALAGVFAALAARLVLDDRAS